MAGEMRFDVEKMNMLSTKLYKLSQTVRNQSAGQTTLSSEGDVAETVVALDGQITKVGQTLADLILRTSALVEESASRLSSTDASIGEQY